MKLKYEFEAMEIGNELTMVPLDSNSFKGVLRLNGVAADIVRLLGRDTTEDEMVREMLKIYDTTEENIRRDVRKVTDHLRAEGLLIG